MNVSLLNPNPAAIVLPFDLAAAARHVRFLEDSWNLRELNTLVSACAHDCTWRHRTDSGTSREHIHSLLTETWSRQLDSRLVMSLWGCRENRMAVRLQCEWRDGTDQWWRSYGNELWEFDDAGLIHRLEASINDLPISESERSFRWAAPGPRPAAHPGIPNLA
ncbi:MAG: DUF1348 family protein [Tepidisphaera sp.]|nr:DUF1348 family protein [Tepidisphaera sp.]